MKYGFIFGIFLILLLSGCANSSNNNSSTITENNNTVVQDGNAYYQSNTTDYQSNGTEQKKCDNVIDYKVLISALPTQVNGYKADEPQGNTLTFADPSSSDTLKYSVASNTLTNGDKTIDVSITDTCYINYLSMSWTGYYEMEGTQGFFKKTSIKGQEGWHQYEKSSDRYSYVLFVSKRVLVSVTGDQGVSDEDVTAVANAIDFNILSNASKS